MADENDLCLLTTIDNPFSPFTNWIKWLNYDKAFGYNTCEFLARLCPISNSLTDEENYRNINLAVDEIIINDFRNIYRKVREDDYEVNGLIKESTKKRFLSHSNAETGKAEE